MYTPTVMQHCKCQRKLDSTCLNIAKTRFGVDPFSLYVQQAALPAKVSSGAYIQHACHGQLRVKISVSPRLLRMTRILAGFAAPDDCVPSALAAPWDSHTTSVQPPALGGGRGIIRRPICKLKETKL